MRLNKTKLFGILIVVIFLWSCVASSYSQNIFYKEILIKDCNSCFQAEYPEIRNLLLYEEQIYFYNGLANCLGVSGDVNSVEFAIRITPSELSEYSNWSLSAAAFYHCENTDRPIKLKIYGQGTPYSPGPLLAQKSDTASGKEMIRVDLDTPIELDITRDYWVSFIIYGPLGESIIGMDDGPAVDGKGDWVHSTTYGWVELQNYPDSPLDKNFAIQAFVSAPILMPSVTTNNASNLGYTSATLNGRLNDLGNNASCEVWFEYGLTTLYGTNTNHQTKNLVGNFSEDISGLTQDNTYHYRAVAQNSAGITYGNDTTFIATVENHPPDTPTITGSQSGKPGKKYTYTAHSIDPEEDDIEYWFDWDDGDNTGWQSSSSASHTWELEGNYTIKVKARDEYGAESDWGNLEVTMPKSKVISIPLFLYRLFHCFPLFEKILNQII